MSRRPRPVPVYRGDVPTLDRIRPGFVADYERRGLVVIVENEERKVTA